MATPCNLTVMRQMSESITANDTCVAAKIKYIGPAADDPQVVLAAKDLLFYTNYDTGAVLDDYVFQATVTAGHLETDKNAADMTWGALAALINASDNWRIVLVGARPEDNVYTAAGALQHFLAIAAGTLGKACNTENGEIVYFDSDVAPYHNTCTIGPENQDSTLGSFLGRISKANIYPPLNDVSQFETAAGVEIPGAKAMRATDWTCVLNFLESVSTFTTSRTIEVWAATQTSSRSLLSRAGAATTVKDTATDAPTLWGNPGERLIIRETLVGGSLGSTMLLTSLRVTGAIGVMGPVC
jgi:hypothetical protein